MQLSVCFQRSEQPEKRRWNSAATEKSPPWAAGTAQLLELPCPAFSAAQRCLQSGEAARRKGTLCYIMIIIYHHASCSLLWAQSSPTITADPFCPTVYAD